MEANLAVMALWTLQHLSMKHQDYKLCTASLDRMRKHYSYFSKWEWEEPMLPDPSLSFDCSTHVLDYKHLTRAYSCTFPSRRLQSLVSLWAIALQTCIPNGGALSMHKECSKWMLMCNMDCMILECIECGEGHNAAHWRGGAKTMSLSWGLSQVWQL